MRRNAAIQSALTVLAVFVALIPALLTFAVLLGLGIHRHAPAWSISLSATALVFGPPIVAGGMARRRRGLWFALWATLWSSLLFLGAPIYFPGERRQALVTGLSLGGLSSEGMAQSVANQLPEDPDLAEPEVPEATAVATATAPAPLALAQNQIALPYEGEGRRLSVPVGFANGDVQLDTIWMMLDTGATYTTLPASVMADLGIYPSEKDPEITLHTANGERTARLVLVDRVWLGDLALDGVALATCEGCSSEDTAGLLGLNVTSGFNLNIDADRNEVIFTSRSALNRHLDVKPFVDIGASISRFPGGRIEVEARLENTSPRHVDGASISVYCQEQKWLVELSDISPGDTSSSRRRLPRHEPCDAYQVGLHQASW